MKHLPITNEEKKRKHILENMLYFVELDKKYIEILNHHFLFRKV